MQITEANSLRHGSLVKPIDRVLDRLKRVRARGNGWRALCPAHEDKRPSLDIDESLTGNVLLFCRSHQCTASDICAAIGLDPRDLFASGSRSCAPAPAKLTQPKPDDGEALKEWWPTLPDAMTVNTPAGFKLAVWYFYTPTFVRARYEKPGDKTFRPFHEVEPGKWHLGEPAAPLPLFRVANLLARPNETVHYTEGEKCAHALQATCGYLATTCGSSSNANKTDFQPLAGRNVVIWPDNDEPGIKHAERVATKLQELRANVRVMPIPSGATKGSDVVDWYGLKVYGDVLAMVPEIFPNAKPI